MVDGKHIILRERNEVASASVLLRADHEDFVVSTLNDEANIWESR